MLTPHAILFPVGIASLSESGSGVLASVEQRAVWGGSLDLCHLLTSMVAALPSQLQAGT